MNPTALSVFIFGIYLLLVGLSFLIIPNVILPILKFEKTTEFWPRILGSVIILLGYYYLVAAQNDMTAFFWATVYGRFFILLSFIVLVVIKKAKPMVIMFGVVDCLCALWTLLTLV